MTSSYRCTFCGTSFSGSSSWSSGGPEYSCSSCSSKGKKAYEERKRAYESRSGGGSGCAIVAILLVAAPILTASAWMIIT